MQDKKGRPEGAVLVLGAGIAGMQSALDLANAGYFVHLVDQNVSIGGVMAQLDKTFPTNDCSTCMISPKLIEVATNPNIEIISRSEVLSLTGEPGDFTARVRKAPRFIDEDVCSGCGECVKVCPVSVPADFNQGLNRRKAIYRHFPQAIPGAYAVDKRGESPCKHACPAGISVQGYVALIAQGRHREALALIRKDNPLPAVCGRVCTHPCEAACARGQHDEPIAIRELKRFAADWEVAQGAMDLPTPEPAERERVAIVGSGPAGLTAAYYLRLAGYRPTIFEALPEPGGMLRVGIPAYRLPRETLDYEIAYITRLGVEIRLNAPIASDQELQALKDQGFAAAFLAVGAHKPTRLGISGEGLPGVRAGVDFLREAALGQKPAVGARVAVIGGGNVAVDAARVALRQGAREVTVYYRRSEAEMPAYAEEVTEAREEGITFVFLAAPLRLTEKEGRLAGLELQDMRLGEPDASGRRRPEPIPGSERAVAVDTVLVAVGQKVDLDFLEPKSELAQTRDARLVADPLTLQTSLPWVFAGGDAVSGAATVVEAIRAGKEAALSIGRFLRGEDLGAGRGEVREVAAPEGERPPREPRRRPPALDPAARKKNYAEVVGPLSEEAARAEADRCLACGICSECYQCLTVCQAQAIDHAMKPKELELKVGAVIMAPGFQTFAAGGRPEFGYGRYPNVMTSLEFERLNSASGPTGGHLKRPSDGKVPGKVAWIQCVGSRDLSIGRDYCSYVCCMYASKQAVIGMEHAPGLEAAIFYMDIRAQGKGFDRYYERARDQHGVRYVRSMVSRVREDRATGDLLLAYHDEAGQEHEERFDLVILSVGLVPHPKGVAAARRLGVATDRFGFAERQELNPLITSRPGVFACGVFQAPRDIPETVTQASGAAAQAGELLAEARGSRVTVAEYPAEREVGGEPPRIGVFVCHCGINIAGVVDVAAVANYAGGLPGVVLATDFLFTCSTDSQKKMAEAIAEHHLNRVVVASCSPRTHEPLFRDTLRQAGLNPYLFEMANIRDQCSWVHQAAPADATLKAEDLVRMSVARAALLAPLHELPSRVTQAALVIGGGPAGLTAALSLADQGFQVHLVEREAALGGLGLRLHATLEGHPAALIVGELVDRALHHGNLRVHLNAKVLETRGHVGALVSRIESGGQESELGHGVTIVATGAREHQPKGYGLGEDPRVLTQLGFGEALADDPAALEGVERVVMIQCVGSREQEHSYCSRVCCGQAVANALAIKRRKPSCQVTVLFRDIRTYGLKELKYQEARAAGVVFLRFDPAEPPVISRREGGLAVTVRDLALRAPVALPADRLVLSTAVRPQADAAELASALKLPLDADGFFMEAHLKLRPVDFVNAGHFLAGSAHGPKYLEEVVAQAKGAAARAATILAREEMMVGGEVAVVDPDRCVVCLTCVRTCPYGVPQVGPQGVVAIDPAACQGCGSCASACPRKAITVQHHSDAQVMAKARAVWG